MKVKDILSRACTVGLLAGLALTAQVASAAGRPFFSPLPWTVAHAGSGLYFGAGPLRQSYAETIPSSGARGASDGVADSEHGWLPQVRLGMDWLFPHLSIGAHVGYGFGSTRYEGALQQCQAGGGCVLIPHATTTKNTMLVLSGHVGWGFSPLPHLAVIPAAVVGLHKWKRRITGTGGYTEKYSDTDVSLRLDTRYAVTPRWLVSVDGRIGRTFSPSMKASLFPGKFELGSEIFYAVGGGLAWTPVPAVTLSVRDEYLVFKYGKSKPHPIGNGLAANEPDSRTVENRLWLGARYHF